MRRTLTVLQIPGFPYFSESQADLQCGFKAFKKEVFAEVGPRIQDDLWFFDTELVVWARRCGFRIKEIPVDWRENRFDERKSKLGVLRNSWEFLGNLFSLRRRLRRAA